MDTNIIIFQQNKTINMFEFVEFLKHEKEKIDTIIENALKARNYSISSSFGNWIDETKNSNFIIHRLDFFEKLINESLPINDEYNYKFIVRELKDQDSLGLFFSVEGINKLIKKSTSYKISSCYKNAATQNSSYWGLI